MEPTIIADEYDRTVEALIEKLETLRAAGVEYLPIPLCTGCAAAKASADNKEPTTKNPTKILFLTDADPTDDERELLAKMIKAMELSPEDVTIIHRAPCKAGGTIKAPTACAAALKRDIEASGARVIVTLGEAAMTTMLTSSRPFKIQRGSWREAPSLDKIMVMATHPLSNLLANKVLKRETWEDLKKVMAELKKD